MKLPVKPKNSCEIIDDDGVRICIINTGTINRDQIIQAINYHEKLREAFGLARSMILSGEKMTKQAESIFEQALQEKP